MKSTWFAQRDEMQRLAVREGLPSKGACGKLNDALNFAEMLTLAPSGAAVERLLREDCNGALSFLDVINDMTAAMEDAVQMPSTSPIQGPFHELADFVVEFLNAAREEKTDEFV